MVAVRTLAVKTVLRKGELSKLGLPDRYLATSASIKNQQALLSKFVEASQVLLLSIHDNAPFYPAPIRKAANDTHAAVKNLINKHLTALTQLGQGIDLTIDEQFIADGGAMVQAIIEGNDSVEPLIRDRLASVEVATVQSWR